MSSRRSYDIVEHAVADFANSAATDTDLDALAGRGLGAWAEMERLGRKWHDKLGRGDKKTLDDFATLRRWRATWLAAAKLAASRGAAALDINIAKTTAALATPDPT
jgi:hypothetical protein